MTAPNETSKDTTAYGHRRRHFGNYGTGTRIPKIRLHKLHLDYLNIAWTLIWKEKKKLAENPTLLLSIRTLAWLIQSMDNPRKKKGKKEEEKSPRDATPLSVQSYTFVDLFPLFRLRFIVLSKTTAYPAMGYLWTWTLRFTQFH